MSGKQMEGDNQRRRALARQARERGEQPGGSRVTLGAGKQIDSLQDRRRSGPPAAGTEHKPTSARGGPVPAASPRPAEPQWPRGRPRDDGPAADDAGGPARIRYRELVADVGRQAGVDFAEARAAAKATVTALAQALRETDRERLLGALPAELYARPALSGDGWRPELAAFLEEVAWLSDGTTEQARYRAQATLGAIAEQDRDLIESLDLPTALWDLLAPLPAEADQATTTGATALLTEGELASAMSRLPYWENDGQALSRTIALPAANLERVLERLARLKPEYGRGPSISRPSPGSALLTVHTRRADGITAADVDLAERIDDVIDEAGAGIT